MVKLCRVRNFTVIKLSLICYEKLIIRNCQWRRQWSVFNPLTATLKPRSNGPPYGNTVIGIHWPLMGVLLHLVQQRWA